MIIFICSAVCMQAVYWCGKQNTKYTTNNTQHATQLTTQDTLTHTRTHAHTFKTPYTIHITNTDIYHPLHLRLEILN